MCDVILGKSGQSKSCHLSWDVRIHIMVFFIVELKSQDLEYEKDKCE